MTRVTGSKTGHTLEPWTTTKCQRLVRPLKLKISTLKKALATSACVSDGLSSWAPKLHQTDARSEVSSDTPYLNSRPKTYGASRKSNAAKKTYMISNDNLLNVDEVLANVRHENNPALGNAYIGVYYAFKTVLEKAVVETAPCSQFPSLATSAANMVGHCIQLTSSHYTPEPIDANDWYDSVPGHFRSTVMLSYAVQNLVAAYESLAPIMPAFALLLHSSPLAGEVFETLLEHTCLTTASKHAVRTLKNLALQIGRPWSVVQYCTDHFSAENLYSPGLIALIDSTVEEPLHPVLAELYLKIHTVALRVLGSLSQDEDIRKVNKLQSLLQGMQRRVLLTDDKNFSKLLSELVAEHRPAVGPLSLGYALALLPSSPNDLDLLSALERLTSEFQSLDTEKRDCVMKHLTSAFPMGRLVEVIETLVGRENRLVSILAAECSIRLQGDFIHLADEIEKDVTESKSGDDDKYRFEPILNSWVARTPGIRNIRSIKRIIMEDSADEHDEDDEISHPGLFKEDVRREDTGCSSTTILDACKGDEQSPTTSQRAYLQFESHQHNKSQAVASVPPIVHDFLSTKRAADITQSARLLQKYQLLSTKNQGLPSPLLRRTGIMPSDTHALNNESPLCSSGLKRRCLDMEDSPALNRNSNGPKRSRNCFGSPISAGLLTDQFLSTKTAMRTARRPLRELNNLKSSFATKRKRGKFMAEQRLVRSSTFSRDIDRSDTLRSEVDELSML